MSGCFFQTSGYSYVTVFLLSPTVAKTWYQCEPDGRSNSDSRDLL